MIHTMSLEEKIGQLFMFGFQGPEATEEIIELIENHYIGGICYFSRNLENPKQVYTLSTSLQSLVKNNIPLFLSLDQEGGMIVRIEDGVTHSPGNMALAATNNPNYVYKMAQVVGSELRMIGINMNLAPTIDVNNNPLNPVIGVRSFGENPSFVANLGVEAIRGYQSANIAAVAKHFPGHGDTEIDSHLGLPMVNHPLDRIHAVELLPFKQAVENGVDSIMISHVCFPAIEENVPATLSSKMVNGLLRNQFNYQGVVMTDCMEMKAVENHYGVEEATLLAIEAGVDIVLFSHCHNKQKRAISAVISAVKSGRLTESRIDESIQRILHLKEKRKLQKYHVFNEDILASTDHIVLAQQISDESITLVKYDPSLLPLDPKKRTVIMWPKFNITSDIDEHVKKQLTLGDILKSQFTQVEEAELNSSDLEELIRKASYAEQLIIGTYNASINESQKKLVQSIIAGSESKTIICALRNPYDLAVFPHVSTFIAAYENKPNAIRSIAKVLTGEIIAQGTLPVNVSTGA
ncbi:beta-N-acetylhexosaminidase [Cytobacillus suaedae]|nr:beta-N-acetylhexosaminidase [Cytobacillus suaedae]